MIPLWEWGVTLDCTKARPALSAAVRDRCFAIMRPILHRLRRWTVILVALAIVGPFVVAIPLNVVPPPTTAIMLWRSGQRLAQGKRPVYPRRDIVGHDEISRH